MAIKRTFKAELMWVDNDEDIWNETLKKDFIHTIAEFGFTSIRFLSEKVDKNYKEKNYVSCLEKER